MSSVSVKVCSRCKTEKRRNEFSARVKAKDGLHSYCKQCMAEYIRQYHEKNKEKMHEYRDKNKDRISAYNKKYYLENRNMYLEKSRKFRSENPEYNNSYCESNRERIASHERNRRARIRNSDGKHTSKDIDRLLELQRNKCAICKASVKDGYHVDHIVALVNGGGNGPDNLQILCPTCNLSKSTKCPIQFAQEKGLLI